MNEQKFCPNCGAKLSADAMFCPNCGYRFADNSQPTRTESRQHIYDNASNNDDSQNDNDNYGGNGGNDSNYDPNQKPPHKKHNKLVITLIIIIALLVVGGGVAAYKLVLTPGHPNTESSSSSSHKSSASSSSAASSSTTSSTTSSASSSAQATVSADDTNSIMGDVFSTAADSVNNGGDMEDVSDDFVNEDSNSSYQSLSDWVNLQKKNDDINSVDISVQDLTTTGNKASFKVKYVFHQPDGRPDHVQIFNWYAKMNQDNDGDLKIASLTGDKTAASDYDE